MVRKHGPRTGARTRRWARAGLPQPLVLPARRRVAGQGLGPPSSSRHRSRAGGVTPPGPPISPATPPRPRPTTTPSGPGAPDTFLRPGSGSMPPPGEARSPMDRPARPAEPVGRAAYRFVVLPCGGWSCGPTMPSKWTQRRPRAAPSARTARVIPPGRCSQTLRSSRRISPPAATTAASGPLRGSETGSRRGPSRRGTGHEGRRHHKGRAGRGRSGRASPRGVRSRGGTTTPRNVGYGRRAPSFRLAGSPQARLTGAVSRAPVVPWGRPRPAWGVHRRVAVARSVPDAEMPPVGASGRARPTWAPLRPGKVLGAGREALVQPEGVVAWVPVSDPVRASQRVRPRVGLGGGG